MSSDKVSGYLDAFKRYLAGKSTGQAMGLGAAVGGGTGAAKNLVVAGLIRNTALKDKLLFNDLNPSSPIAGVVNPLIRASNTLVKSEDPLSAYGLAAGVGLGLGGIRGGILGLAAKKSTKKLASAILTKHAESAAGKVLRASGSGLVGGLKGYGLGALGLAGLREAVLSAKGLDSALEATNAATLPALLASSALGAGLGLKKALKPGAELVVPKSYLARGLGTGAGIGALTGVSTHNYMIRELMEELSRTGAATADWAESIGKAAAQKGLGSAPTQDINKQINDVASDILTSAPARLLSAQLGLGLAGAGAVTGGGLGLGIGGVQKLLNRASKGGVK